MKNIIAKEANRAALELAIKEAEGRATVRTLSVNKLFRTLKSVDEYLKGFSSMKDAIGTEIEVDVNAQSFPSAYKYIPESTVFNAIRTASGWKVVNIYRDNCKAPSKAVVFKFTEATIRNMSARLSAMDAWSI